MSILDLWVLWRKKGAIGPVAKEASAPEEASFGGLNTRWEAALSRTQAYSYSFPLSAGRGLVDR